MLKISAAFATNDREALIAAVVGGAGIMRIGMFDPTLITSGRVTRLLTEWSCVGGFSVYAMYRKASRRAPKVAAFLEFAEAAVAAFDGDELTIRHTPLAHGNRRVRESGRLLSRDLNPA